MLFSAAPTGYIRLSLLYFNILTMDLLEAELSCSDREWQCKNGQCLYKSHVCDDNRYDCNDKSDEDPAMCSHWNCTVGRWKCKDGLQCITEYLVCNAVHNCNDKSDEDRAFCAKWDCYAGSMRKMIPLWKCNDGFQCVGEEERCNGEPDCKDKSDEDHSMCGPQWNCSSWHVKCANNWQCIRDRHVCDKIPECDDGSDELCNDPCLKVPLASEDKPIIRRCPEDSSFCIPVSMYCDGIAQCPDAGDEIQSNCTCQDWGLISCHWLGHVEKMCLNKNWISTDTPNLNVSKCQEFLNDIHNSVASLENRTGMYASLITRDTNCTHTI